MCVCVCVCVWVGVGGAVSRGESRHQASIDEHSSACTADRSHLGTGARSDAQAPEYQALPA